jgi:peptide/nickel transport system substrate-binding protein
MRIKLSSVFAIGLLLVAIVGVGTLSTTLAQSAPVTVTVATSAEPVLLDPHRATERFTSIFLTNIFDSLLSRGTDLAISPNLATSWVQVQPDVWQFELREGVTFHNGEPFNAAAVKFTIDRFIDPEFNSPQATHVRTVTGAEVIDEYTVNIHTNGPDALLLARMSELFGVILPPQYIAEVGDDGFAAHPIGTGPWKFVEWAKNERIVLEAFDDYWQGRPEVDRLVLRPIPEAASRIASLIAGEVDLIDAVPYVLIPQLETYPNLEVLPVGTSRVFFLVLDTTKPPFDDVRVRQALNFALDVESIVAGVARGQGWPVATFVVPGSTGYDPTIEAYPYDPERARELLAEAGYPDGIVVDFDSFTGSIADHAVLAEAIAGQISDAGFRTNLTIRDFSVFAPMRASLNTAPMYAYSYGNWALDVAAIAASLVQGHSGYYYTSSEVTALIDQANQEMDPQERNRLLSEVQRIFKEDAPYAYLYQHSAVYAKNENLEFTPREDEILRFYPLSIR